MGFPSTVAYSSHGIQSLESYDLSGLDPAQFSLVQAALSDSIGFAKFFSPPNPLDVSHSLVNFQNDYSSTTPYIEVPTVDIKTLVNEQDLGHISIAKFDIEGAEIQVIPFMLASGIFPGQILVEYDELNFPSARGRNNFEKVHQLMQGFGYETIWFDGRTCVSYRRTKP
jgi:FkbM family methyltransferase